MIGVAPIGSINGDSKEPTADPQLAKACGIAWRSPPPHTPAPISVAVGQRRPLRVLSRINVWTHRKEQFPAGPVDVEKHICLYGAAVHLCLHDATSKGLL